MKICHFSIFTLFKETNKNIIIPSFIILLFYFIIIARSPRVIPVTRTGMGNLYGDGCQNESPRGYWDGEGYSSIPVYILAPDGDPVGIPDEEHGFPIFCFNFTSLLRFHSSNTVKIRFCVRKIHDVIRNVFVTILSSYNYLIGDSIIWVFKGCYH